MRIGMRIGPVYVGGRLTGRIPKGSGENVDGILLLSGLMLFAVIWPVAWVAHHVFGVHHLSNGDVVEITIMNLFGIIMFFLIALIFAAEGLATSAFATIVTWLGGLYVMIRVIDESYAHHWYEVPGYMMFALPLLIVATTIMLGVVFLAVNLAGDDT